MVALSYEPGASSDDLAQRLLRQRIVLFTSVITDETAEQLIAKILRMAKDDKSYPMRLLVHSPGGGAEASLRILEAMDWISAPIYTHCWGLAGGSTAVIVAHGAEGHRTANAQAVFDMLPLRVGCDPLLPIFAEDTGETPKALATRVAVFSRLSAGEAQEWGIIDRIVENSEVSARPK